MVATASSAAADISSHVETVHPQFSASTEPVHSSVGVAVRLGSDGSTGNRSESPNSEEPEESCAPMDLSSGGVASQAVMATPSFMMAAAAAASMANQNTPTSLADSLLNARRLAELVRAQQNLRKEVDATPLQAKPESSLTPPLLPRKRAWPELQLDLSAMVSEKLKKRTEDIVPQTAPPPPTSPSESNSSGGGTSTTPSSNKEVKKRRLDQLLSKKFSVNDSPPPSNNNEVITTPTLNEGVAFPIRRDSSERKQNRRKRSSPVTLSLRPNSDLFESPKIEVTANEQEEKAAEKSIEAASETDESKNALKNQLLQLHLAQAALMNQPGSPLFSGFPGLPGLPGSSPASAGPPTGNPLLYYGYYAQMIQGLQSQQQKLLEQLTGKVAAKNVLSTPNPISSKVIFLSILFFSI